MVKLRVLFKNSGGDHVVKHRPIAVDSDNEGGHEGPMNKTSTISGTKNGFGTSEMKDEYDF